MKAFEEARRRQSILKIATELNLPEDIAAEVLNTRGLIFNVADRQDLSELENANLKSENIDNFMQAVANLANSRLPRENQLARIRNLVATTANTIRENANQMLQRRDQVDLRPQAFNADAGRSLAPLQKISDSNAEVMPATKAKLFDFKLSPTMIIAAFGIVGTLLYFGKKKSKKASRKR